MKIFGDEKSVPSQLARKSDPNHYPHLNIYPFFPLFTKKRGRWTFRFSIQHHYHHTCVERLVLIDFQPKFWWMVVQYNNVHTIFFCQRRQFFTCFTCYYSKLVNNPNKDTEIQQVNLLRKSITNHSKYKYIKSIKRKIIFNCTCIVYYQVSIFNCYI